jgi:DNA modification methylase
MAFPMHRALEIVNRPIAELKGYPRNARRHARKQLRQLSASIREFGFCTPVLLDETDMLIAGHGRLEAARQLGLETVPTITITGLSEQQKAALRLADNKIAENASWDLELLAHELQFIGASVEFDVTVTGFETAEIDLTLQAGAEKDERADAVPMLDPSRPPISALCDCWLLGEHRLLCGDARNDEHYRALLQGEKAMMVFTDPPYNTRIDGQVSGLGAAHHREFVMASGEMSDPEYVAFLRETACRLYEHTRDGAILYLCIDWRQISRAIPAAEEAGVALINVCVWNKSNAGMGSLYRSKHELILVLKHGTASHINNIELGRHGRYRTNVWDYAGASSFGAERSSNLRLHPTVKPVALIADAIHDCSSRGGIILDAFAGSGSTIIAAEITGRRAYALELDPLYVDGAVRRWQKYTGGEAIHAATGATFAAIAAIRAGVDQQRPALPAPTEEGPLND